MTISAKAGIARLPGNDENHYNSREEGAEDEDGGGRKK
jgi:hypothetical protein